MMATTVNICVPFWNLALACLPVYVISLIQWISIMKIEREKITTKQPPVITWWRGQWSLLITLITKKSPSPQYITLTVAVNVLRECPHTPRQNSACAKTHQLSPWTASKSLSETPTTTTTTWETRPWPLPPFEQQRITACNHLHSSRDDSNNRGGRRTRHTTGRRRCDRKDRSKGTTKSPSSL